MKLYKKHIIAGTIVGFFLLIAVSKIFAVETPSCPREGNGDVAHYDSGLHQIYGGGLQEGSDDVYTVDGGFLQCYCGPDGSGIQTTWTASSSGELGTQWNLGENHYQVENKPFSCNTVTPTPTIQEGFTDRRGGGDGLSDGRSDGKSSCPLCTATPDVPKGPPATGFGK